MKKIQNTGLIILIVGLIIIGLWFGVIYLVFGGIQNFNPSSLGLGIGTVVYMMFLLILSVGIFLTILGLVYSVATTPRLKKNQRRGLAILIVGLIIISITLGLDWYICEWNCVASLGMWGGGYAQYAIIFFLVISSFLIIIGLLYLLSTARKEKEEIK